jgi:hypothetical protein
MQVRRDLNSDKQVTANDNVVVGNFGGNRIQMGYAERLAA